ncbi:sugar phosphate isomerase/epimerase family protein [Rhodopirellula sp. MGV]|uniref:sugar phosphate isomerase/epimerase family protein n=1 Tax=Rhodopirellula sp. MGV TaxID=2023130 RepID=UPI000B95F28A|nr:sugar phosphate isomerase/epimerase family protein [Rhodopirellula sp. MGV]OYP35426.1 xylose isomerase [Rhodopirellula sp. MGV]PNY33866.1 sugar phosphate isomerase/epimerase [Rhodopirellula baltica]
MNKLSVSQISTLRWDLEADVHAYYERGFNGIGLYRPKVEDFGIERTAELLAERSMTATSLSWAGGFTGSDGRSFEESVSDGIAAVLQAAELGAETVIILAGGKNNHIKTHLHRVLCQALRRIAAVASEHGVKVALEPFHPGCGDEWSFVNDLDATLDIIDRVDNPSLGLVFDTYHQGMDDEVIRAFADYAPYINLVQLGDGRHSPNGEMNRCLLGEGRIPLMELMDLLVRHSYQGAVEVELIGEDIEHIGYDEVLDHTRQFLSQTLPLRC